MPLTLIIRQLNRFPYETVWHAMQLFTKQRSKETHDELWLLEHEPVFTQGLAGKKEHLLNARNIPVVQTDRGGQITYHGPGQLMIYTLFDTNRLKLNTRELVVKLEHAIIELLQDFQINARCDRDAPGVYVDKAKICSIGLRIKKGFCYHGLALNIAMDLDPFSQINPCGYRNLAITQIQSFQSDIKLATVRERLLPHIIDNFGYTSQFITHDLPEELMNERKKITL